MSPTRRLLALALLATAATTPTASASRVNFPFVLDKEAAAKLAESGYSWNKDHEKSFSFNDFDTYLSLAREQFRSTYPELYELAHKLGEPPDFYRKLDSDSFEHSHFSLSSEYLEKLKESNPESFGLLMKLREQWEDSSDKQDAKESGKSDDSDRRNIFGDSDKFDWKKHRNDKGTDHHNPKDHDPYTFTELSEYESPGSANLLQISPPGPTPSSNAIPLPTAALAGALALSAAFVRRSRRA